MVLGTQPATMGLVCTMLHEGDRKYEVRIHGVEMLMEHAKHSTLDGYLACFGEDTMLLQPRSTHDLFPRGQVPGSDIKRRRINASQVVVM